MAYVQDLVDELDNLALVIDENTKKIVEKEKRKLRKKHFFECIDNSEQVLQLFSIYNYERSNSEILFACTSENN